MKIKIAFLFLVVFFALSSIFLLQQTKADVVKSKYFNYVEKGGRTVKTSPSTQYKLMESYPQATVTVYEAGTETLASIWSDKDGLSIKANPFIADTDSFFYFYVDCGKYDIKFSGGNIQAPYSWGDVFICGTIGSGTGNVSTLGGTENFITKFTSSTSIGDSVLYNPLHVQASSSTFFGWTSGLATASLDVAIGRDSAGKLEINSGTLNDLRSLTLHRIEPIPTATIPGLNFGVIASDPTNPVIGDCWYNSSLSAFRCFLGSTVTLSTGSGITSINALTAAAQFLVTGTSGSDFNISSTTATHTFNLPNAGVSARGVVSTTAQSFGGKKTFTPTSIFAGFNFGTFAGDPSTVIDGDCWYNTVLEKYRCVEDGITVNIINAGGSIINPTDTFVPYRFNATTFSDSRIRRESTNVTAITGGAGTPQTLKLYKGDNGASFQVLQWHINADDQFEMLSDAGIETPRNLAFKVAGSTNKMILGTGALLSSIDRGLDLGSGANQWDELFAFTIVLDDDAAGGGVHWKNKAKITSPGDGVIEIEKSASSAGAADGTMRFIPNRPSILSGDQNNLTISTNAKYVEIDADGDLAINGFVTTPSQLDGQEHILINISSHNITIPHQSLSATATNRFITTTGLAIVLAPGEAVRIWYSPNPTSRWRAYKWQ